MPLSNMLTPRLVELGAIRIGTLGEERTSQAGNTYRMPQKLDHFLITTRFRDEHGRLKVDQEIMEALAVDHASPDGNIREIPIAVLSDNVEDFLKSCWVSYRGRKCLARSDGETLWKYCDLKTGEQLPEPEELEWKPEYETQTFKKAPLFKKHTTLDCVIALPEARWGGVYRFRTTSLITGDQLYGSLMHLRGLTGGVLTAMPLVLCIRPVQVAPEGKTTTVYVVHVELRGADLLALQSRALEVAQFQKDNKTRLSQVRREMKLLMHDPGLDEDESTRADAQDDFHPEPVNRFLDTFVDRVAACLSEYTLDELSNQIEVMDPPLPEDELSECLMYIARRREQLQAMNDDPIDVEVKA